MPTAKKVLPINGIHKNWYVNWNMVTQAGYKVHVLMTDSSKTQYVNNTTQELPRKQLSFGYSQVKGDELRIEVNVEGSADLSIRDTHYEVHNERGEHVGTLHNIWVEDASDRDFNDLVVTLVACRGEK